MPIITKDPGDGPALTRRALLRGGAATALGVLVGGCAVLPDLVRRGDGTHPCDARFCRYFAPPRPGSGAATGTCTLPVRASGGP